MTFFEASSRVAWSGRVTACVKSSEPWRGISQADRNIAEAHWRRLGEDGVRLAYENLILNALDIGVDENSIAVDCGVMPYRCVLAGLRHDVPTIRPVAVTGMVEAKLAGKRCILIGRRSEATASHGDFLETPPSGGLETADIRTDGTVNIEGRLLSELKEETGIGEGDVASISVTGVYFDRPTRTIDILATIRLAGDAIDVSSSGEYHDLEWIAVDRLGGFLEAPDRRIVNASRVMLERAANATCDGETGR